MIEEFKSQLAKRGFSKPTLFVIQFTSAPEALRSATRGDTILDDLRFFAETAEFPGLQMMTQELRYYDVSQKFAYGKTFDDFNLTFRMDRDYQVKRFMDAWIDVIYSQETGDLTYKKDYTGEILITQLMEDGKSAYSVNLIDAFPTQIQSIQVGWDSNGQYTKLNTIFSFRKIIIKANEALFENKTTGITTPQTMVGSTVIPGNTLAPISGSGYQPGITPGISPEAQAMIDEKRTLNGVPIAVGPQQIPQGFKPDYASILSRVGSFSNNRLVTTTVPYISMGIKALGY